MADLPHQRLAAVGADIVEKSLRTLYFGDETGAGMSGENRARKNDHQLIAPDEPSGLVDDADAVAISVEGDCEIGMVFGNRVEGKFHILDDSGIGMVVGKAAIWFAEQF